MLQRMTCHAENESASSDSLAAKKEGHVSLGQRICPWVIRDGSYLLESAFVGICSLELMARVESSQKKINSRAAVAIGLCVPIILTDYRYGWKEKEKEMGMRINGSLWGTSM